MPDMHVTPPDEAERVLALQALKILDTAEDEAFDRLTQLAGVIFGVPMAFISLVDGRRQWFKSKVGLHFSEIPREISFCTHTLCQNEPMVVPDASADDRFKDNPLVREQPHLRFYAGAQLRTQGKHHLGTFAILDNQPRPAPSSEQLTLLKDLAATATLLIEQRRIVLESEERATKLALAERRMRAAKGEAEAANASTQALFSRLSHELRTPLAAINGFAELLADSPLTPEQKSDLEEIRNAGRNLLAMIDSLLQAQRVPPE